MRAAAVTGDHGLEVVTVDDPTPGPGELVLRVSACGICGSDLKVIHTMPAGYVMGHEFCGEVVAVGSGAEGFREGDAVSAMPVFGCGRCAACLAGDVFHCASADLLGVLGSPGAYAEYVRVSAREAFRLPPSLAGGYGALVEPLAVGLHAVNAAGLRPGDRVLVIGAGPVGLAVTTWLSRLGAGEVVVSDPLPARRESATAFGATAVVDPGAGPLGGPYDVVIECVGAPGMVDTCVAEAGLRGRIVVAGVCMKPDPFVPVLAVMKEVSMRFVLYYSRAEFAHTVAALEAGRIDPAPFVTDEIGLDGADEAFRRLTSGTTDRKILIRPFA